MSDTFERKSQHLDIVLNRDVSAHAVSAGFEAVRFEHCALPEMALSDVDLGIPFLNRKLDAPLLISSMTGGPARAESINRAIAEAAQHHKIAFGVGSQRVALEQQSAGSASGGFGPELRRLAPDVPILANFGGAQLTAWNNPDMARRAAEMIAADALIIHLNPLQEAVQPEGDRDWRGVLKAIETLARESPVPLIVKEVGAGISGPIARRLWDAGVRVIDVAGAGGTSWAAVEGERATDPRTRQLARVFRDWGIPAARAIVDVRAVCPNVTLIASGGIDDGVTAAKALRLGADLAGMAAGVLEAALQGGEALSDRIGGVIDELRLTCFCTGSRTLDALRQARLTDKGPL